MIFYVILSILLCLNAYSIFGIPLADSILALTGSIFLIKFKKPKVDVNYLLLLTVLFLVGIISLAFSSNIPKSLSGLLLYLNCIIYYLLFTSEKFSRDKLINISTFVLAVSAVLFILFQGVIYKNRISGNIGYANTYALLMIIGLYFNKIKIKTKYDDFIELILVLAVIYTNSRNSLLYLLVYILAVTMIEWKAASDRLKHVLIFSAALALYALLWKIGLLVVLLLPIILIIYMYFIKQSKAAFKKYLSGAAIIVGIVMFFSIGTNLSKRISNISTKTGVLQERLVYYEDVVKAIIKNPFGMGINTFEYKQFQNQSAFYDSKFIHNSFIQTAYDLGIQGLIIFMLLFFLGLAIIYKKKENKLYFLILYISITLHSMLDFDLSYSSILIFQILIIASCADNERDLPQKIVFPTAAFSIIFSLYLVVVNFLYFAANFLNTNKYYDQALKTYSMISSITSKDPDTSYDKGQIYLNKYLASSSKDDLNNALQSFIRSYEINNWRPSTAWKIGYIYYELKDMDKYMYYSDTAIAKSKYYPDFYKEYYKNLQQLYSDSKDNVYKDKINEIEEKFDIAAKTLNTRANYMKGQLPRDFNELFK